MRIFILLITLSVLSFGCASHHEPKKATASHCRQNRAAIDLGSGSTKLKVAVVDHCAKKILSILDESKRSVKYADKMEDGRFPDSLENEGLKALEELTAIARKHGVQKIPGVATSAFRKAANGQDFLDTFNGSIDGLNIKVIRNEEEGLIGYRGVGLKVAQPAPFVVWDIGGGSMQITAKKDDSNLQYLGKKASVSFKNKVIELRKALDPAAPETKSPNPISKELFEESLEWVETFARNELVDREELKELMSSQKVYGIGGVHKYSIAGQLGSSSWTQESLRHFIETKSLDKSDEQLEPDPKKRKYVTTNVTNLILVLGYMKALDIKSVTALDINLTDTLLLEQP